MDDIGDKSETQSTTHDKNSDEPSKKGDVINSDENVDESSVSNHVDGGVNSVTNDESQLDTGNGDDVKETEPQLPSTEPEPRSTEPVEKDTVTSPSENKRNDDEDSTKLQTDINDSQVADDNMQDEKVSDLELDKPESPCAEVEDTKPDEPSTEETETSNTAPDSPSKESIETKKSSSESAEKIDESVKNIAECKEKVDKVVTESAEQVDESIGDSIDNVCETITESSSIVKENAGDEDTGKATIEDEQETIEDEQATNDADVSMSDEIENAAEESTEKMDVDCLRESTETKVSQENGDKVKEDALSQDDDLDNIRFENAPKVQNDSMEHCSQQSLDPFDALLNTASDSHNDSSGAMKTPTTDIAELNNVSEDEDAGADLDGTAADTEEQAPEEDIPVADLESAGADEEVCLLPDTEREISEEDKEKALEQRKLAQENQTIKSPHSIVADDVAENNVETGEMNDESAEVTEDAVELADGVDDSVVEGAEVEKEKDKDDEKDEEDVIAEEPLPSNIIQEITTTERVCSQCTLDKTCIYRYLKDGTMNFICHDDCLKAFQEAHPDQYTVELKKNLIEEIEPKEKLCSNCEELKICYFSYKEDGETYQYCSETCLHDMMGDDKDKYSYKRKKIVVEERDATEATCHKCEETKDCTLSMTRFGELKHVCGQQCLDALNSEEGNRYKLKRKVVKRVQPAKKKEILIVKKTPLLKLKVISNATDKYLDEKYKIQARTPAAAAAAREEKEKSFIRKCSQCFLSVNGTEKNLSWETMDFCDEFCLSRYQNAHGSKCANCKSNVNNTSLGKYCVRFGYDIRQFCCSTCLEEFKKGLKICCYCQRDISVDYDGFLAPIGDKGQFKDFCSQQCMEKFDQMSKNPVPPPVMAKCAVCSVQKMTSIEVEVDENHEQRLCSEPCFAAFKFVNSIYPDQCKWCKKYFERTTSRCFTIYDPTMTHCFCSKLCLNVYISNTRHIVPCNWCKVKKYNFDMIKRNLQTGQSVMMCSLNCLNLYQVSVNAVSSRRIKCDQCKRTSQAQYHLTMSDATVRNFCTYQCVMSFQGQYNKAPMLLEGDQSKQAVPTGAPRRTTSMQKNNASAKQSQQSQQQALPVISNVQSLATRAKSKRQSASEQATQASSMAPKPAKPVPIPPPPPPPPPKIYNHVLVKTLPPLVVANKATMTKPQYVSKGISCRPHAITKECQTDDSLERRVLVPIPVPIYVPVPCAMYSLPFPLPVPIPIPIPTPVFIPTTRNSANGIMKEIKKIHDKMPTDPFEAELLMMAEMVAGDKKRESDSETDDEENTYPNESNMEGNQSGFGEDVLQMALKMATEPYDEQVDLESAMTANTITPNSHPITAVPYSGMDEGAMQHLMVLEASRRGAVPPPPQRKRTQAAPQPPPTPPPARGGGRGRKRRDPPPPEPPREPQEKPDANMCLKYTFGVNAWKQWVMTKNAELEKSSIRRKPFKSEILQLTADELNFSLCLFVKEVRKPNGSEYAPDTIYYLVLGIQQYLFENGRIDNIFTDPYYEKFTDCLDEVARKFSVLYNDSQYIVTRVEEEHLWECKQLGAHSPHVLLSTLMFFNTKHFNLVTVEEHMQLSFSHIMKHWKRNPNQPGSMKVGGSRNVLLRFYPPQSALEANSRKKKVYEQQENEENPLRCPVKLYEFYISKCPESVRTRNDVFYLMPERSCVPDSPVWYSTQPLAREALAKMLHRVKMVKEINIALLTS